MRLDELRRRSAESAQQEAEALERHAPAAERDATATRELARAAGDLAAVPLGGFLPGGSKPVASAGGETPAAATSPGDTIGSGGASTSKGFSPGPRFLSSQPGQGREGGRILAEKWIGEHCTQVTFEVPNPQNTAAIAEADFVQVPGWDCSRALGVPPGTVVYYDPEAWETLQGFVKLSKTSSGGGGLRGSGGPASPAFGGSVNKNPGRGTGSAGGTGVLGSSAPPPPATTLTDQKVLRLLADIASATAKTATEIQKRPAGPSGSKGQRLV